MKNTITIIISVVSLYIALRSCAQVVAGVSISFPEPTCLLVSTKTRSSGIIHFKGPRFWDFRFYDACVPWFKTWCLEIKSMWMRIECLCGTNQHWLYLWTPFLSQSMHAQWNRNSKILDSWNGLFQSSMSWRWPKDKWALGTRLPECKIGLRVYRVEK